MTAKGRQGAPQREYLSAYVEGRLPVPLACPPERIRYCGDNVLVVEWLNLQLPEGQSLQFVNPVEGKIR
jgi:hypothetical protein